MSSYDSHPTPDFRSATDTTSTGTWLHFAGIAGSGMSALAQFHAHSGGLTTGSDRAFDQGKLPHLRKQFEDMGIVIVKQDGSFLDAHKQQCDALVVSTAVEDRVPDVAFAKEAGIDIQHRSELLARYVAEYRTIAISGTSGKSTVTAMVFSILKTCGYNPGLLTGGALVDLVNEGHIGNAWACGTARDGGLPILVIEADESDGSLVRYHPWAGVVLNLGLDHKSTAEVLTMFETFRKNTTGPFIVSRDENLKLLRDQAFYFGICGGDTPVDGTFASEIELLPQGSVFRVDGTLFTLPVSGLYNIFNAVAAVAVCRQLGLDIEDIAEALADFAGVSRRFQHIGTVGEIEVVDDFAHNPDKLAAALAAARQRTTGRLLAVFQPHGFGPTRFLRAALVDSLYDSLSERDILWMPEIFYSGGTVNRDISSADLVNDLLGRGRQARFIADRTGIPAAISSEARPGDLVLVMGARDPSLTDFCKEILTNLGSV